MSVSIRRDYILSTSSRAIRFQPRRQFPFSQDDVTSGKGKDCAYDVGGTSLYWGEDESLWKRFMGVVSDEK